MTMKIHLILKNYAFLLSATFALIAIKIKNYSDKKEELI